MVVGKEFFEEVIFDQRPEGGEVVSHADILWEELSKCRKQRVKPPE